MLLGRMGPDSQRILVPTPVRQPTFARPSRGWGGGGWGEGREEASSQREGSDFASKGFCALGCQARAGSSAKQETGLQQRCFSLGFPEAISCFLIQTIRSRLTSAESPNACTKITVLWARQELACTGLSPTGPCRPGRVLSWHPPWGTLAAGHSTHTHTREGPPCASNF